MEEDLGEKEFGDERVEPDRGMASRLHSLQHVLRKNQPVDSGND